MEKLHKLSEDIQSAIEKALDSDAFKSLADATNKASDEETGRFEVIITTEDVDRMGEIILADGWAFENYMKNPVVLWGHDYHQLPVGVTDSIEKTADGKMIAKGRFAPASANPFAQQVRMLYDLGVVRATSVGFIPKKQEGNIITEAELLEYSFVSVPANPMALSTLVKSEISVNELVLKGILQVEDKKDEEVSPEETDKTPVVESPDVIVEVPAEAPVADGEVVETPAQEAPEAVVEKPEGEILEEIAETPVSEEKVQEIVKILKEATVALEGALHSERKGVPTEDSEASDEVRAFKEFTEHRRILQIASTVIGDVLAEARRSIEAKKSPR